MIIDRLMNLSCVINYVMRQCSTIICRCRSNSRELCTICSLLLCLLWYLL